MRRCDAKDYFSTHARAQSSIWTVYSPSLEWMATLRRQDQLCQHPAMWSTSLGTFFSPHECIQKIKARHTSVRIGRSAVVTALKKSCGCVMTLMIQSAMSSVESTVESVMLPVCSAACAVPNINDAGGVHPILVIYSGSASRGPWNTTRPSRSRSTSSKRLYTSGVAWSWKYTGTSDGKDRLFPWAPHLQ